MEERAGTERQVSACSPEGWTLAVCQCTHLVINQSCQRKVVEQVREVLPDVCVAILPQAFVVEPVYLRDLSRLVIASQDGHTIPVAHLQGNEEGDGFDGVVASVHIVAHEKIICVR